MFCLVELRCGENLALDGSAERVVGFEVSDKLIHVLIILKAKVPEGVDETPRESEPCVSNLVL